MSTDSSSCEITPKTWVVNIRKMLEEKEAENARVCILRVRKVLRGIKPEDYTPQLIGLGPYHHWRQDLFELELYKLIAAKKAVAEDDDKRAVRTLEELVSGLMRDHIAQIRACYDRNWDAEDGPLAWMMVVDALFLLQFLQVFVNNEKPKGHLLWSHQRMSYLADSTQSAYHSILRDIMMLENQIPFIVLRHVVSEPNCIIQEDLLSDLLTTASRKLSPFRHNYQRSCFDYANHSSHLLELLYYLIVPRELAQSRQDCTQRTKDKKGSSEDEPTTYTDLCPGKRCLSNINCGAALVKMSGTVSIKWMHNKFIKFITKLMGLVLPPVMSSRREDPSFDGEPTDAPTIEEIEIPSASALSGVGVKFHPKGDLIPYCISFDKRTGEFNLPIIYIDDNTEVIMRNLVAYEAAAIPGILVLARYTELMNGIIDKAEDAKLLRERGIIRSYLRRDSDVAAMWNLMSRSIRLSHVDSIDKAIREVNEYYASKKRVRFFKFTKYCTICGRKIIILLFALLLLVLMFIQSFCEFYRCPRLLAAAEGSGTQA